MSQGAGRFQVTLGNFRGFKLAKKDDGNTNSSPYLVCNFDNYKKFKTEAISKTTDPVWVEQVCLHPPHKWISCVSNMVIAAAII